MTVTEHAHVAAHGLVKIYSVGGQDIVALAGLDLDVQRGEVVALVGASGSGKSTLVNVLAGLEEPTAGRVRVGGHDLATMGSTERTHYRRDVVGFVWQQTGRNLLPYLDARANVEVPLALAGRGRRERRRRSAELLEIVGLADRATHRPSQLSGGEQQRVAIAVALASAPELLLADEPTGELDTETAHAVLDTLRQASHAEGSTVLIVTHDPLVSGSVERTVAIRDGRTATEVRRRRTIGVGGLEEVVAEEFAVVDRTGRVQLPGEYLEELDIRDRVRLGLAHDHISVWPDAAAQRPDEDEAAS